MRQLSPSIICRPKFHSIWKEHPEEPKRDHQETSANAELFPINIPDPSYDPTEEEEDKTEEHNGEVAPPSEEFLVHLDQ